MWHERNSLRGRPSSFWLLFSKSKTVFSVNTRTVPFSVQREPPFIFSGRP